MEIKIKNIGPITKADIDLSGITVLGAANDSGKSTISKVLFATVKSMNNYKDDFLEYKKNRIRAEISDILRRFENNFEEEELDTLIRVGFDLFDYSAISDDIISQLTMDPVGDIENSLYWRKIKEIYLIKQKKISQEDSEIIEESFGNILKLSKITLRELSDELIYSYFKGEFLEITNFNIDEDGKISVTEHDNFVFDLNIDKKSQKSIGEIQAKNIQIEDVTYVEYPLSIEKMVFRNFPRYRMTPMGFAYSQRMNRERDLAEKLTLMQRGVDFIGLEENKYDELIKKINEIVGGNIQYSAQNANRMIFNKQGHTVPIQNVAGGIKSFVTIEILLTNRILREDHLLIIDEPEINLHPIWQVKYAEIIVLIYQKLKTKFFINSHSSFFMEAIKLYSEKYKVGKNVNFYTLSSEQAGSSSKKIEDLSEIFEQLNGAFDIMDDERARMFGDVAEDDSYADR